MDRKPLKPSDTSNQQPRSGLSSLKRAWSGSSKDLGTATFQRQAGQQHGSQGSSQGGKLTQGSQRSVRESSPEVFYEGWSSSPDIANMASSKHSLESDGGSGPSKRPRSGLQNSTNATGSVALHQTQGGRKLPAIFNQSSKELLKNKSKASIFSKSGNVSATDTKATFAKVFLSQEQQQVLHKVVEQHQNVFYTGSAGTGKSVLLREIIKELKLRYARSPESVAITASTGIAACNVGGTTLHSFGGIGIGTGSVPQLLSWIRKNRAAVRRWLTVKVLIIDEVSMLDADLFDKLEEIARLLRKTPKPFGGIQLVVTGDFFQLPPVTYNNSPKFAFEAKCWSNVIQYQCNLTQVFRQKDQTFVDMLNEMRFGKLTHKSISIFKSLDRVPNHGKDVTPTELFPRREDVERANTTRLSALDSETRTFRANDSGRLPKDQLEKTLANFMAPQVLPLKIKAQVMLIKNLDESLVNGSIGYIVDFRSVSAASRDEGGIAPPGMVPSFDDADGSLLSVKQEKGEGSSSAPGIRSRSASPVKGVSGDSGLEFPYVFFPQANRYLLCKPEVWKNEDNAGEILAQRTQVPLILAWAMSIHKAQGQTIPYCKIDLRRIFEKGQAYVALSRATSLEGLQVLGFDASKVMAHPRVINWSRKTFPDTFTA